MYGSMPRGPLQTWLKLPKRVRRAVTKAYTIHLTLSAEVATARATNGNESLISRADAALYRAKRAGCNCVVTAGTHA